MRPCSYSGFTSYRDFTEAHKTSKGGLEDFRSSENVLLTLGWTPSIQIHRKNPDFHQALQADNAGLQADGLVAQQQVVQQGYQPQPVVLFTVAEGIEIWNNRRRVVHRDNFPLSDHLFTLMAIVQADLTEPHRERLTSHLAIRGIPLQKLYI